MPRNGSGHRYTLVLDLDETLIHYNDKVYKAYQENALVQFIA